MRRRPSFAVLVFGSLSFALVACVVWLWLFPLRADYHSGPPPETGLKMIGTAVLIYSTDFDDRFPPDMSSPSAAWPALQAYLKVGQAPKGPNKDSPEYLGNGTLGGRRVKDFDQERTIMFFESAPLDGHRLVLFVNGAVRKLTEVEFQKAVANDWKLPAKP